MQGTPGPDFPGGLGESEHIGRPDTTYINKVADNTGLQAMGMKGWQANGELQLEGERRMLRRGNDILGFGASV